MLPLEKAIKTVEKTYKRHRSMVPETLSEQERNNIYESLFEIKEGTLSSLRNLYSIGSGVGPNLMGFTEPDHAPRECFERYKDRFNDYLQTAERIVTYSKIMADRDDTSRSGLLAKIKSEPYRRTA